MAASLGQVFARCSSSLNESVFLVKTAVCPLYNVTQVMYMRGKHYNPKFKARRREKNLFFNRKQYQENQDILKENVSFLERRKQLKKFDQYAEPERGFETRPITFLSSAAVFDPYVPPEGDGKHSLLGKEGLKDTGKKLLKKAQARAQAVRKIRKYGEENFSVKDLAPELQDIYIEAHELLTDYKTNEGRLHDLVANTAYSKMTYNLDRMTMHWEFVESIEPPKVVHVVCEQSTVKDVYFAQVTLRLHTKQKLALYDQFGRLMYGSPHVEQDVLDFVVFEKNIVDLYGKWRILDKIVPDWRPKGHKIASYRMSPKEMYEEVDRDKEEQEIKPLKKKARKSDAEVQETAV